MINTEDKSKCSLILTAPHGLYNCFSQKSLNTQLSNPQCLNTWAGRAAVFISVHIYYGHYTVFSAKTLLLLYKNHIFNTKYCYTMFLKISIYYFSNNLKKRITVLTKLLRSITVFKIGNNKNTILEHQISILEWFLKDHVTLKTGVMMLKINISKICKITVAFAQFKEYLMCFPLRIWNVFTGRICLSHHLCHCTPGPNIQNGIQDQGKKM